jgi:hypothetical protein
MDTPDMQGSGARRAHVYIVREGSMFIGAPVKEVWRLALDYPSWQNYSIVRHISGEPGGEGEVVLLKKEEAGVQTTPYYARTIKLEPKRRVIWKTFRDDTDYFGIVEFRVEGKDGGSQFSFNVLYEHVVTYNDEADVDAFRIRQYGNVDTLFSTILPKLKNLAEENSSVKA